MKIKKVRLENFRGFEGVHEFELHDDNINVIIGANGAGKTSILDAISALYANKYNIVRKDLFILPTELFKKDDKTLSFKGTAQSNNKPKSCELNAFFTINPNSGIFIAAIKRKVDGELIDLYNPIVKKEDVIFYHYNTKRKFETDPTHTKPLDNKLFNLEPDRTLQWAFKKELNKGNYNSFFKWYIDQWTIQLNEKFKAEDPKLEIPKVSYITKLLNTFIQNLDDCNYKKIFVDKSIYDYGEKLRVFIEKKNGRNFEFSQLSEGEKLTLGMLLEIAHNIVTKENGSEQPLFKATGIVLIDEIELHLHPKWQTSILQALSKTFPNIQFIVTTHSPLVINHLKNENLILIDDFKITEGINVQSVYGRDVNSIITDFMGASARPKKVDDLINDIEVLLDEDQPNINLAKEKLNELKNITSPNHSEALKLETLITIEEED